jgi:hypothetical protein
VPPYAVEPGTLLVDRYRLERHLGDTDGTASWRAHDELLDRPIRVFLLGPGEPERAERVLRAARSAAAVSDPRFLRVLDASRDSDGAVYVVTEWVDAPTLADVLAGGPLRPAQARRTAMEVAAALAAAHRQGLTHQCLTPENVLRTSQGQVKIAGLGVDAAIRGLDTAGGEEAARRDTRGAAALLYAALTARWPGAQPTALAPAPYDGDHLCTPRQVRAGIPDDLDQLTCRGLDEHAGADPVTSAAELSGLLADASVTTRIPAVGRTPADSGDTPLPVAGSGGYAQRSRPVAARLAWIAAALVLVVGLGLAGWQVVIAAFDSPGGASPADQPSQSASEDTSGPSSGPLRVAAVDTFDPPPAGNGEENADRVDRVIDEDPATVWTTKTYEQQFGPGGLKDGVGVLLDLGERRSVTGVTVALEGGATDLQLRTADQPGEQADDFTPVARTAGAIGSARLRADEPSEARYLLVWITGLPATDRGFRAEIAEISVEG